MDGNHENYSLPSSITMCTLGTSFRIRTLPCLALIVDPSHFQIGVPHMCTKCASFAFSIESGHMLARHNLFALPCS